MIFTHNIAPEIFTVGPVAIRWYGLLFAVGLVLFYLVARWAFKKAFGRGKAVMARLESACIYMFFGLVIGARLGEVLFYEPQYFLSNPVEILKIWNGGLSSHGAAIGLFLAYFLWIFVHKVKFSQYIDALVLGMPLVAGFVRIGNFMNSEIVGVPSGESFGVVFSRLGESFARHPVQLYEGLLSFAVFVVLIWIFKNYRKRLPTLFFMFLYILLYFNGRFVLEFWKDLHVLPASFPLSMGQVLSILPILIGIGGLLFLFKRSSD